MLPKKQAGKNTDKFSVSYCAEAEPRLTNGTEFSVSTKTSRFRKRVALFYEAFDKNAKVAQSKPEDA